MAKKTLRHINKRKNKIHNKKQPTRKRRGKGLMGKLFSRKKKTKIVKVGTPILEQLNRAHAYKEFKNNPQPAHKTIQHMMDELKFKN